MRTFFLKCWHRACAEFHFVRAKHFERLGYVIDAEYELDEGNRHSVEAMLL